MQHTSKQPAPSSQSRFAAALASIDAAHREDPHRAFHEGTEVPAEWLYAERMTRWLTRLAPDASEALRLAVRCQHLYRWTLPREQFPRDRDGYLRWRTTLAQLQANRAGELLQSVGYEEALVARVQTLIRKEQLKLDPETQLLEDVVGLVFLENYLLDFARGQPAEKLQTILRKTWAKMSPLGRQAALTLHLPAEVRSILDTALKT